MKADAAATSARSGLTVAYGALAALAFTLHAKGVHGEFLTWDDAAFITSEPMIRRGVTPGGLAWAFTSGSAGNWIPLTRLSWMLDVSLLGLRSGAMHLVSAALHAAGTAAAGWAWMRLTGHRWAAVGAALVFAIHPLQTEAVAWLTGRKDVLAALFAFLALGWSVGDSAKGRAPRPGAAAAAFAASLMAKQAALLLPVFLFLWHERLPWRQRARHVWPLATLAALAAAVGPLGLAPGNWTADDAGRPPWTASVHAPWAVVKYLRAFLWPAGLCYHHPLPDHVPVAEGTASLVVLTALTTAAWRSRTRAREMWLGWVWFLAMFTPASGLVPFGPQGWAERFGHLGAAGLGAGFAAAAGQLVRADRSPRPLRHAVLAACGLLACAWISLTWRQLSFWRTSEALFRRAIAVERASPWPHFHLGTTHELRGRPAEARAAFAAAVQIDPHFLPARYNLACLFMAQKRPADALVMILPVVHSRPDWAEAHLVCANALVGTGRRPEALAHYESATRLNPDLPTAARNAAILRRETAPANSGTPR